MICVITASMPEKDLYIPEGSFCIAADKGLLQLRDRGVEPDLVVGDFDSLGYVPEARELVRRSVPEPPEKGAKDV